MSNPSAENSFGPFPPEEFDAWAASYDQSVLDDGFPFTGYARVLETILEKTRAAPREAVLDLGVGTGNLAARFDALGCQVWGLDFSKEMLALARGKLPQAVLSQADISGPWPADFQRRFHHIVSAYTFHHFPLREKIALCRRILKEHRLPGGSLVIADLAFDDAADQERMRRRLGQAWEEEYYWLASETGPAFAAAGLQTRFTRVSDCAAVFEIGWLAEQPPA